MQVKHVVFTFTHSGTRFQTWWYLAPNCWIVWTNGPYDENRKVCGFSLTRLCAHVASACFNFSHQRRVQVQDLLLTHNTQLLQEHDTTIMFMSFQCWCKHSKGKCFFFPWCMNTAVREVAHSIAWATTILGVIMCGDGANVNSMHHVNHMGRRRHNKCDGSDRLCDSDRKCLLLKKIEIKKTVTETLISPFKVLISEYIIWLQQMERNAQRAWRDYLSQTSTHPRAHNRDNCWWHFF